MKRILVIVSAFLMAMGCGTLGRTPEEENHIAQLVQQRLDERTFTINVHYMMPLPVPAKPLNEL